MSWMPQLGHESNPISTPLCLLWGTHARPLRNYWPNYPSKRLYVKRTGHETHDEIAIITEAQLQAGALHLHT